MVQIGGAVLIIAVAGGMINSTGGMGMIGNLALAVLAGTLEMNVAAPAARE